MTDTTPLRLLEQLRAHPWVDLTHAFRPGIPHYHAFPDEQRTVVVLRHVLELTPGEIAAVLDLPRGTVNSRLRRGLDALEDWARRAR